MNDASTNKFYIQSIDRALKIIDIIAKTDGRNLNLTMIANGIGLPVSTTYRILQNLIAWEYIRENEDGSYNLGFKLITLGSIAKNKIGVRNAAHQYITNLRDTTGFTVYLASLDESRGEVVYIDKIDSKGNIKLAAGIGSRCSIHSTANGKILVSDFEEDRIISLINIMGMQRHTDQTITDIPTFLSEIKKVRNNGYAVDNVENEPGVRCVAAPIYDYKKRISASISISGIASVITPESIEDKYKSLVMDTAARISREMGFKA